MEPEPTQQPLTQAQEQTQQDTQNSMEISTEGSTSTSQAAAPPSNALNSPARVTLPLASALTPHSHLGPSPSHAHLPQLSTHPSLISPSTQPSQLSAHPLTAASPSTLNSQATAEATAANIAAGKAPVPLSLASRPKPTSAFGVAEEAGVLSQGPNPLPYTVPPTEDSSAEVEGTGQGEVAVPGPKRVISDVEMDGMTVEEVNELEKTRGASWIAAKDVVGMSVDEIVKQGFGRNKTGKSN